MTKKLYAKCEENSKNLKSLPDYDTLVKASRLLNDGSYWGPEAEATLSPSDINMDALKIQMKLFLKQYGKDVDVDDISSESFSELVDQVMQLKTDGTNTIENKEAVKTETIVNLPDDSTSGSF